MAKTLHSKACSLIDSPFPSFLPMLLRRGPATSRSLYRIFQAINGDVSRIFWAQNFRSLFGAKPLNSAYQGLEARRRRRPRLVRAALAAGRATRPVPFRVAVADFSGSVRHHSIVVEESFPVVLTRDTLFLFIIPTLPSFFSQLTPSIASTRRASCAYAPLLFEQRYSPHILRPHHRSQGNRVRVIISTAPPIPSSLRSSFHPALLEILAFAMPPFRNPFNRRPGPAALSGLGPVNDENARPASNGSPAKPLSSAAEERPGYGSSRTSSGISIARSNKEPDEFKLSGG